MKSQAQIWAAQVKLTGLLSCPSRSHPCSLASLPSLSVRLTEAVAQAADWLWVLNSLHQLAPTARTPPSVPWVGKRHREEEDMWRGRKYWVRTPENEKSRGWHIISEGGVAFGMLPHVWGGLGLALQSDYLYLGVREQEQFGSESSLNNLLQHSTTDLLGKRKTPQHETEFPFLHKSFH